MGRRENSKISTSFGLLDIRGHRSANSRPISDVSKVFWRMWQQSKDSSFGDTPVNIIWSIYIQNRIVSKPCQRSRNSLKSLPEIRICFSIQRIVGGDQWRRRFIRKIIKIIIKKRPNKTKLSWHCSFEGFFCIFQNESNNREMGTTVLRLWLLKTN